MRLSKTDLETITHAVHSVDPEAVVYLFGSRVDDSKKGGDVDLFVVSDGIRFEDELRIRRNILDQIGWQKLDLIVKRNNELGSGIVDLAMQNGIKL